MLRRTIAVVFMDGYIAQHVEMMAHFLEAHYIESKMVIAVIFIVTAKLLTYEWEKFKCPFRNPLKKWL